MKRGRSATFSLADPLKRMSEGNRMRQFLAVTMRRQFLLASGFFLVQWFISSTSLLAQPDIGEMTKINRNMGSPIDIDPEQVSAAGIRQLRGKHLLLYTDIPERVDIDELTTVFDAAVPQWCRLLDVREVKTKPWCLVAFLIRDREKFQKTGLMPDDLPDFPTGFNRGFHFWVYEQPGNYYTRHLVLHEGTHAFMQWFLSGSGPAWYSEGMAEKIGLHRWHNQVLEINARLTSSQQCDYWGRPRFINEALQRNRGVRLDQVFDFGAINFKDVGSYAWSWAACEFLSRHPTAADEFRRLTKHAEDTSTAFSAKFKSWFTKAEWDELEQDWRLFVTELTYGTTSDRTSLTAAQVREAAHGTEVSLRCDRSWQLVGRQVKDGEVLSLSATGEFTVMQVDPARPLRDQDFHFPDELQSILFERESSSSTEESESGGKNKNASSVAAVERTKIPCDAGGITLRYYRGNRLGMLMAAVLQEDQTLSDPIPVGLDQSFTTNASGTLVFRINESPAQMHDNAGKLQILFIN
jgi:hypothetical protein